MQIVVLKEIEEHFTGLRHMTRGLVAPGSKQSPLRQYPHGAEQGAVGGHNHIPQSIARERLQDLPQESRAWLPTGLARPGTSYFVAAPGWMAAPGPRWCTIFAQ